MSDRVQKYPPAIGLGLLGGLARTECESLLLGVVKIVNRELQV